jgi:hypothetical protein
VTFGLLWQGRRTPLLERLIQLLEARAAKLERDVPEK